MRTPAGARGGVSSPGSEEPQKIALFSVGNMCTHQPLMEALLGLGLRDTLRRLAASPHPIVQKNCARIQARLAHRGFAVHASAI